MMPRCSNPDCPSQQKSNPNIIRHGTFFRSSDQQFVQRFLCKDCGKRFSKATGTDAFGQKKRHLNLEVLILLSSAMSMRRMAIYLHTNRKTIARKLKYLSKVCWKMNQAMLRSQNNLSVVEFDEMETFEHTKCKPLAIALAVQEKTRVMLGFEVSSMPAKGKLASIARKKYGFRKNERRQGLKTLLNKIKPYVSPRVVLKSDQCPFYPSVVRQVFEDKSDSQVTHRQFKGIRGCITGQGELKKSLHDPLFSLNHTAAMLRANIHRLFRRTWNTTKKAECLVHHLNIYMYFHNTVLLNKTKTLDVLGI